MLRKRIALTTRVDVVEADRIQVERLVVDFKHGRARVTYQMLDSATGRPVGGEVTIQRRTLGRLDRLVKTDKETFEEVVLKLLQRMTNSDSTTTIVEE